MGDDNDYASIASATVDATSLAEASVHTRQAYIDKAFKSYFERDYKNAMVLLRTVTLDDLKSIGIFVNCAYDFWRSVNPIRALNPMSMSSSRMLIDDALEFDPEKVEEVVEEDAATREEARRKRNLERSKGQRAYKNLQMNITQEQMMMFETQSSVISAVPLPSEHPESRLDGFGSMSTMSGMELFEKNDDQHEALDAARKAFTQLLGSRNRTLIQAFDYVRLSHIYITEGALAGALQICQLGQARGHLENTLIIIQMWSLLSRLHNKKNDAEHCMQYLVSAVQLEPRDNIDDDETKKSTQAGPATGMIMVQNSDLPLTYMYLFCASYLHRKSVAANRLDPLNPSASTNGSRERELCYNVLAEAYTIAYNEHVASIKDLMDWFLDSQMFYEMAVYLENTAFPLLAEEALYESFLRAPLDDLPLHYLVSMMNKHKRGAKRYIFEVMGRAYQHNPWNMFMREWLEDYENYEIMKRKTYDNKYQKQFAVEKILVCKIQGCFRGYLLRVRHWPAIYWKAKKKLDEFTEKVDIAEQAFKHVAKVLLEDRGRRWREFASFQKELKRISSTKLQGQVRRMIATSYTKNKRFRAIRANGLFMQAAQNYYDMQRTRLLRRWEAIWRAEVTNKSATCLIRTLISNGYSQVFQAACEQILGVIRVRRKFACRKYYHEIVLRYRVRQKLHARCTIRFFIRDQIERAKEKKRKEILERRQKAVQILQEKSTAYIYPLMLSMWQIWRAELYERQVARAKLKIAIWVPLKHRRNRAKSTIYIKRCKYEIHRAFEKNCLFNRLGRYLLFWRKDQGVRPFQRGLRMFIARKRRRRWEKIYFEMGKIIHRKAMIVKEAIMWRCKKFIFLRRREYHRAARVITLAFVHWLKVRHIFRNSKRKPLAYRFVWTMHCLVLRRAFKKMSSGVSGLHSLLILGPMFLSRWRQVVRLGFWRWKRYMIQQHRIDGIMHATITHRLNKAFWRGSGETMIICKKKTYANDELGSEGMARTAFVMSWETPVPVVSPCPVIENRSKNLLFMNSQMRVKIKAFKTFMASYRYRHRLKRNGDLGVGLISKQLVYPLKLYLFMRQRRIIALQCCYRQHLARCELVRQQKKAVRMGELFNRYKLIPRFHIFNFLYKRSIQQFKARWIIQCFYRKFIATRNKVNEQKRYMDWLFESSEAIRLNSQSRRAVVRKVWYKMQGFYIDSMCEIHPNGQGMRTTLGNLLKQTNLSLNTNNMPPPAPDLSESAFNIRSNDSSDASVTTIGSGTSFKHFDPHRTAPGRLGGKSKSKVIKASSIASGTAGLVGKRKVGRGNPNVQYGYSITEEYKQDHGLTDIDGDPDQKELEMNLALSLHRLQQTGVFIYDTTSKAVVGKDLKYILRSAQTTFCQNVTSSALASIFEHYSGNKLVFCGGGFSFYDMVSFMHFVSRRRDELSVHFSDVTNSSFMSTLGLMLCLGAPSDTIADMLGMLCQKARISPPQWGCLDKLTELSVDTNSVGSMGLAALLGAIRLNISLEILIVKVSYKNSLLPGVHGKCLQLLEHNNTLKELRIFGCPLGEKEVQGLYHAVRYGLQGLVLLEFSAAPEAQIVSDNIIRLAKDRLYAGRGSLSVSVL